MSDLRTLLTHVEFLALRATSQGREFTVRVTRDSVWLPVLTENAWAFAIVAGMRADDEMVARAVRDVCGGGSGA